MELKNWIIQNNLDCVFVSENQILLNDKNYLILDHKEEMIFDQDFELIIAPEEDESIQCNDIHYLIFEFGGKWYYSEVGKNNLNIFKNIGICKPNDFDFDFPYIGIHGKYEICSGNGDYIDWCKKAKFFNISTLGICETNTLAGTLTFQLACKKYGIKSILGETILVKSEKSEYFLKVYAKDEIGWNRILHINSEIKVKNEGYVSEEYVLDHPEGIICILNTSIDIELISKYKKSFKEDLYFQIDPVEWSSDEKDKEYLLLLKNYFDNFVEVVKPILICDSYYLDKDEAHIKKALNQIGKNGFYNQSKNQYFKPLKDVYDEFNSIFGSEDIFLNIFETSLSSLEELNDKCNFEIELGVLHLPQYELRENQKHYESHEALFWDLIFEGFERKIAERGLDEQVYLDRIQREAEVIIKGNLVDYFLILWDIIDWCKDNDILVGTGRGSAVGSLIVYCLDITKINPLKYDLIFERFLNSGRITHTIKEQMVNINDNIKLHIESKVVILRNEQEITLAAKDIKEGDQIISY